MAGFAEILGGIGQAMREDRIREQEQGEKRSKGIADLLMKQAEDDNLTPQEQAQSRQAALRILQTGKVGKQDEQMLVDSVLRMNMPAPPATQAPMPQPGDDAAAEPYRPVLEAPPGSGRGPTVGDIKAEREAKAQEKKIRLIASINESLAKTKEESERARRQKELDELDPTGEKFNAVQRANFLRGHRLEEFAPPPTQVQRPLVVGKNLVSPTGEVLFTAKEEDKLDPSLSFERHEDQITGNVTVIGRDPKTGAEKFRNVEKGVSRNRPPIALIQTGDLTDQQFRRMRSLDTAFRQEPTVKQFTEVASGVNTIREASQRADGVGDVTLMRLFAKITDPTTGVREEEYRTMQGAQGALQQLQVFLTPGKWKEGQTLTPAARQAFLKMAEKVLAGREKQARQTLNRYRVQAKSAGVDEKMLDLAELTPPPAATAGTPIVQRNSKGEFRHSLDGGKTWQAGKPK